MGQGNSIQAFVCSQELHQVREVQGLKNSLKKILSSSRFMLSMVPRSRNGKYTNDMRKREKEREQVSEKQLSPVWDMLAKEKENEYKVCQSFPRHRRKLGDAQLNLWILLETILFLVTSSSFPALSIFCPWLTHLSTCLFLFCFFE